VTDILLGPGSGPANVLSLFGTFAGEQILGLLAPDDWWRNDNLLIALGDEVLNDGISGYTASWYFNIYLSDTPGAGESVLICRRATSIQDWLCNRRNLAGYNYYYTDYARGDFSVEPRLEAPPPVPIPAALPLMGSALAFMAAIGWRRRRAARVANCGGRAEA
jgi:hypothetical protein